MNSAPAAEVDSSSTVAVCNRCVLLRFQFSCRCSI